MPIELSRDAFDQFIASSGATPPPAEGECSTTVQLAAVESIRFDTDAIEVPAGEDFCVELTNNDTVPHDFGVVENQFTGDIVQPGESMTYVVPALEAGDYTFLCTLHPTAMVGDLTVTE